MNQHLQDPGFSLGAWVRATWLGWLLGVPCIAVLALVAEQVHLGGLQVFVGAGMGLAVGALQARLLRRTLPAVSPWIAATTVGLALPFLAWDIAQANGATWPYYLAACVALGGVAIGLGQAQLLRRVFPSPTAWVLVSALGWGLAGAFASGADLLIRTHSIRGVLGAALYLAFMTLPGALLGLITGRVLTTKWRNPAG